MNESPHAVSRSAEGEAAPGPAGRPRRPVRRFVVVFALIMLGYYAVTVTPPFEELIFPPVHRFYAAVSARILNVMGYHVVQDAADDRVLRAGDFEVEVRRGCDAIEPTALFVAAVLAYPLRVRGRWRGVAAGIVVLGLINLVRIVTLYMTALYFPSAFDVMHTQVWQAAFIILAVIFFVLWIRWASRLDTAAPVGGTPEALRGGSGGGA